MVKKRFPFAGQMLNRLEDRFEKMDTILYRLIYFVLQSKFFADRIIECHKILKSYTDPSNTALQKNFIQHLQGFRYCIS